MINTETVEAAGRSAKTDAMAGLGTRRGLDADVPATERMISRGGSSDMVVTVIDLDGLKQVSDNRGHAEGDYRMKMCSAGITQPLRINDRAYRIGGDDFVILSPLSGRPPVPGGVAR